MVILLQVTWSGQQGREKETMNPGLGRWLRPKFISQNLYMLKRAGKAWHGVVSLESHLRGRQGSWGLLVRHLSLFGEIPGG